MKPVTFSQQSQAIVYDADVLPGADAQMFDPAYWRAAGALQGSAPGRGTAHFVDSPFGQLVLRRYLRGGLVVHLSRDRYLFTGVKKSRPFMEFDVLRRMAGAGLRVPEPVAAMCDRTGPFYRAAIMTQRITPARPLTAHFDDPDYDWSQLGRELARFHNAGMNHADLNARNILVHTETGLPWLIDLDASRFHPGRPVDGRRNLARLKRSLDKLWSNASERLEACWEQLLQGYGS